LEEKLKLRPINVAVLAITVSSHLRVAPMFDA